MSDQPTPAAPPTLTERLAGLKKQQEQAIAQVNYLAGAIAMLEALLVERAAAAPTQDKKE